MFIKNILVCKFKQQVKARVLIDQIVLFVDWSSSVSSPNTVAPWFLKQKELVLQWLSNLLFLSDNIP
jgi:hypothetical protein